MTPNRDSNYNKDRTLLSAAISCREMFEVEQMSNIRKVEMSLSSETIKGMTAGYEEMGMLNLSLSEEGLDQDRNELESYEKYLVESE